MCKRRTEEICENGKPQHAVDIIPGSYRIVSRAVVLTIYDCSVVECATFSLCIVFIIFSIKYKASDLTSQLV